MAAGEEADGRGRDLAQFGLVIPPVEGGVVGHACAGEVRMTDGGVAGDTDDVTRPTEALSVQWVTMTPAEGH